MGVDPARLPQRIVSSSRLKAQLERFPDGSFDLNADSIASEECGAPISERSNMASVKAELDRYFGLFQRRLPFKVSAFIRWLREPASFWIRVIVAGLLILGGIFSFLPLFGLWMLPLGLLLIAQDIPILQRPLLVALKWTEAKWKQMRALFNSKP